MNEITPFSAPEPSEQTDPSPPAPRGYRPWSRGRVWTLFFLGVQSAGFMTFFFHPVFSFMAFAFGLPAVILAAMEVRDYPEARNAGPVRWGRITGLIGLIGGSVSFVLFFLTIGLLVL